MESEPELDAKVATEVMGWNRTEVRGNWYQTRDGVTDWHNIVAMVDWSPSTDWGAAGMVVDRLTELGFDLCISNDMQKVNGAWRCVIYLPRGDINVFADTPLHAICLAALRAIQGQVTRPDSPSPSMSPQSHHQSYTVRHDHPQP